MNPPTTPPDVTLRAMQGEDLPIFYEQQLDPESRHMAGFTIPNPTDRGAFIGHWMAVMHDATVVNRTILYQGAVAGNIGRFDLLGVPSIGYWLGREFWGKGIATAALRLFLVEIPTRPLYARALKDNVASVRVLEKCGFQVIAEEITMSNVRHVEVEEYLFELP